MQNTVFKLAARRAASCVAGFCLGAVAACGTPADDLQQLVALALAHNPQVQAARHRLQKASAERDELAGFFDPALSLEARRLATVTDRRETFAQAGAAVPLLPGAYLEAAVEEHYFDRLGDLTTDDISRLYRSLARVGVNIPLWQDRGWRQWHLQNQRARHTQDAASNEVNAICQALRHTVESCYLKWIESDALLDVARMAVERADKLLAESTAMAQLHALPEYQIHAARAAAALRREEMLAAQETLESARIRLETVLATPQATLPQPPEATVFINWADSLKLPESYENAEVLPARGIYAQLTEQIAAQQAACEIARDQQCARLALFAELELYGEDPDQPLASGRYLNAQDYAASAGVIWSRPLGWRAEKARWRAQNAQLAALGEMLRQLEQEISADLAATHNRFQRAKARLQESKTAVTAAQQSLAAEDERFRLGEGRSRNVLDAQKDLTDALKRQIVTAVELLLAYYEFHYSAGYAALEK